MAAGSKRPSSITIIGILTLIQAAALVAPGLYMAFASSYLSSNMLFIPGAIEPGTFTMLQKAWGSIAIALGLASAAVGFAMLGGKKRAWISNVIVTGAGVASVVAIHDIKYLPAGALLLPLAVLGTILASLFAPGVRSSFGRPLSSARPRT